MASIQDIISSPLLLVLVIGGLGYITAFSVVYLLKARKRALEMGITNEEINNIIKSSLIFSIVPSLSIVIGLVALAASLGTIWAWWRLSVIGSLSYETQIASTLASALSYTSTADMMANASGREFGVVMILMWNIASLKVSAFRLTLLSFIGQVFTGIVLDLLIGNGFSKQIFVGGMFVVVGVLVNMFTDKKEG